MVTKQRLERVIYDSLGNPIATVNSGQLVTTLKDSSGNEQYGNSAIVDVTSGRASVNTFLNDNGTIRQLGGDVQDFGGINRVAQFGLNGLWLWTGAQYTQAASVNTGQLVTTIKDSSGNEQYGLSQQGDVNTVNGAAGTGLDTSGDTNRIQSSSMIQAWDGTSIRAVKMDDSTNRSLFVSPKIDGVAQYGLSAQATVDSHGHLLVNTIRHEEEVALGLVTGEKSLRKFGRNATVGGSYEPIADDGFTFATDLDMSISSAQPMEVIHASDLSAGNGAKKIVVEGVDGSGNETSETLTLGAASPTSLVNDYMWINRAYVTEVGSNGSNIGDINIQTTAGATPASKKYAIIPADEGQTLQCIFYVPNDYTYGLIIKKWDVRTGSGKAGNARLRTKKQALIGTEESWRTRDTLRFYQNHVIVPYEESPLVITPNTLVRVEALVDAGTADIAANFWGHLQ